ncbi:MAG TPA: metalloregulator ArsR/SmtB family transcription factor [Gemmatimonadaceae bacterium]|nr:metalloregulator ArsR/SmtB family transcription factor [Gemmatimonadaceae bacterium]
MTSDRQVTLDAADIGRTAEMIRVLGHPVRLRLVEALERGERCVSELQGAVSAPQAIVSQQLAKMRAAGIVSCRRDGANVRYAVADARVLRVLDCLRHCEPRTRTARRKPSTARK